MLWLINRLLLHVSLPRVSLCISKFTSTQDICNLSTKKTSFPQSVQLLLICSLEGCFVVARERDWYIDRLPVRVLIKKEQSPTIHASISCVSLYLSHFHVCFHTVHKREGLVYRQAASPRAN